MQSVLYIIILEFTNTYSLNTYFHKVQQSVSRNNLMEIYIILLLLIIVCIKWNNQIVVRMCRLQSILHLLSTVFYKFILQCWIFYYFNAYKYNLKSSLDEIKGILKFFFTITFKKSFFNKKLNMKYYIIWLITLSFTGSFTYY